MRDASLWPMMRHNLYCCTALLLLSLEFSAGLVTRAAPEALQPHWICITDHQGIPFAANQGVASGQVTA